MKDGFHSLISGQHETLATSLLQKTAYHKGVNTALRNGLVQTRPSLRRLAVEDLPSGTFKGAGFINQDDESKLCIAVGAYVTLVDLNDQMEVKTLTEAFESEFDKAYICSAEHAIIVQNGEDPAIIHLTHDEYDDDGEIVETTTEEVRPDTDNDGLPIGTHMIYLHGRIFVVTDDKLFKAGDAFVDGTPDSFLEFTETNYINGGGAFGLPADLGNITGFSSTTNTGTTGYGALQVHSNSGVSAFNVAASRRLWGEIDISNLIYMGPGSSSDRSFVHSNADLFFRSTDGLRSFGFTVSNERNPNGLSFRDISREIKPSLDQDTADSLKISSMAKADERLMCTVHPDGTTFQGMAVMDTAPATTITAPASPAWDGIWTGLKVHQILDIVRDGTSEVLIIADLDGELALFVLDDDLVLDNDTTPIESKIYTRAYNFDSTEDKRLTHVEVSVSNIETSSTIKVFYRPTGYPLWAELDTHEILIPTGSLSQPRRKVRFSTEALAVPHNPVTGELLTTGESFEFCLKWVGRLQVETFIAYAEIGTEQFTVAQKEEVEHEVMVGENGIELDDLTYEVMK